MDATVASLTFPVERLERFLCAAYRLSRPCVPGANTPAQLPRWWLFYLAKKALQDGGLMHLGCVAGRALRLTLMLTPDGDCLWLGAARWMEHTQLELETLRDIALGAPYR